MKTVCYTLILFFCTSITNAQWQFAKQIGGAGDDSGKAVIDENENVYCCGGFSGTCYFNTDTLSSLGINDIFLAKYNSNGAELWVKRFGGFNMTNPEGGGILAIDNVNDCFYVTGRFYGTMTIDTCILTSTGNLDAFIAKFDLLGNCLWLKKAGSGSEDRTTGGTMDSNGYIYFSGFLGNNGAFGSYNLNKGCFLSKLDSNGNIMWARNLISGGYSSGYKVQGNYIYVSGQADNDTMSIDTTVYISQNYAGIFMAKLDSTGGFLDGVKFNSNMASFAVDIEIDNLNNMYTVGTFLDSLFIENDTLTNNSVPDYFILKLDSVFEKIWIQQSHSTGVYGAYSANIEFDSNGELYVAGEFSGNALIDTSNVTSSVSSDAFVAKFNANGGCIGVRHFGEARGNGVAVYTNGDVLFSGRFINIINIGSNQFTSHGLWDVFFAKSDAITGLEEEERVASNKLHIYANPNSGKCNITIPDEFLNEKYLTLTVFDHSGKVIQQYTLHLNNGKISLDLEAQAAGVYNVTLSNGPKTYSGRIVFER